MHLVIGSSPNAGAGVATTTYLIPWIRQEGPPLQGATAHTVRSRQMGPTAHPGTQGDPERYRRSKTDNDNDPHWWHDTLPGSVGGAHGAGKEYVVEASPIGYDGTPTPRGTAEYADRPETQRGKWRYWDTNHRDDPGFSGFNSAQKLLSNELTYRTHTVWPDRATTN